MHLIYIDATIECRNRDVKGMYKLMTVQKDFTGIGSNFEIQKLRFES